MCWAKRTAARPWGKSPIGSRFTSKRPRVPGSGLWDFKWDSLPSLATRRALQPVPAGTVDGRLPGYRERVPPEGHEDSPRGLATT